MPPWLGRIPVPLKQDELAEMVGRMVGLQQAA
jgi:hypothetical protein